MELRINRVRINRAQPVLLELIKLLQQTFFVPLGKGFDVQYYQICPITKKKNLIRITGANVIPLELVGSGIASILNREVNIIYLCCLC